MARNEEKAKAMLNLFLRAQREADAPKKERRPYEVATITSIPECERWRRQVIKDIAREVAAIQEAGDEIRIRQQNDHINKLLKEKNHWEKQIKILGGPDYQEQAKQLVDQDGKKPFGIDGYYYFGAARDLSGVRELYEVRKAEPKRRKRGELQKLVDADYFGFFDEEDGKLVTLEERVEKRIRLKAIQAWQIEKQKQEGNEVVELVENKKRAKSKRKGVYDDENSDSDNDHSDQGDSSEDKDDGNDEDEDDDQDEDEDDENTSDKEEILPVNISDNIIEDEIQG